MFTYVDSLLGVAADPAGSIIWPGGQLVTLALAAALVLCTIGLIVLRERARSGGSNQPRPLRGGSLAVRRIGHGGHFGPGRRLPKAA